MTKQNESPRLVELVAVGCVVIDAPGETTEFAGFDAEGAPIVRRRSHEVQPGETFHVDEREAASLLAAGVAHRPGQEPALPDWPLRSDGGSF